MPVGAGQTAEIGAVAGAGAGQEKAGVGGLRQCLLQGCRRHEDGERKTDRRDEFDELAHQFPPGFLSGSFYRYGHQPVPAVIIPPTNRNLQCKSAAAGTAALGNGVETAISWSVGSPRVPSWRHEAGRTSIPRWLPSADHC